MRASRLNPIQPCVIRERYRVRREFEAQSPLEEFVVIPRFLNEELAQEVVHDCKRARYATYCISEDPVTHEAKHEFCEPIDGSSYGTIHQRPVKPIRQLRRLRDLVDTAPVLAALSQMTGLELSSVDGTDVLTCWGPGSFLSRHTDYFEESHARLVLSLSLTEQWRPAYGGATVFAWPDSPAAVRLLPRMNTAVLFRPSPRSVHWVEPIAREAPERRRFTWTVFFR